MVISLWYLVLASDSNKRYSLTLVQFSCSRNLNISVSKPKSPRGLDPVLKHLQLYEQKHPEVGNNISRESIFVGNVSE